MKLRLLIALMAVLFSLAPFAVSAQSVLLPEDRDKSKGSSPGLLGLSPKEETPKPAAPTPSVAPSGTASGTSQAPDSLESLWDKRLTDVKPGGQLAKKPLTPQEQMLAGQLAAGKMPTVKAPSQLEMKIRDYNEKKEREYDRDPTLLTDMPLTKVDDPSLRSALVVTVIPAFLWGPEETALIQKRLGYQAADVPQNCQIRLEATLVTDKDSKKYSDKLLSGQSRTIKYDGLLKSVSLEPAALCLPPKGPLPRKGGVLLQVGDKVGVILLGQGNCPAPPRKDTRYLDIQYNGDGAVTCGYRQ